jgi:hypothetical protein
MRETGYRFIIYKVIMAHIMFICIFALPGFAEEMKQSGEVPILGQPCAGVSHATIDECAEKWCCKTNESCSSNAECREARRQFFATRAGRSYKAFTQLLALSGLHDWMRNFSCLNVNCGTPYLGHDAGERCLMEECREVTSKCFASSDCYAIKYCVIDKVGSRTQCMERYPKGRADYEMWTACGSSTGCFALSGPP